MDSGLIVPIAVSVTFALLAWLVPPRKVTPPGAPLTDAERESARRWELASVGLAAGLAVALGFAWWGLFRLLAAAVVRPGADTVFLLAPDPEAIAIPALFLGIVSAMKGLELALRALLGGRYDRLDLAWQEKAKFDTRRVMTGMYVLVAAGTVAFFVFWAGGITRIGPEGIDRGNGLSLRRDRIPYARVRAVEERASFRAPNGNRVWRRHHAVIFDDGTEWTTQDALRSPRDSDAAAMAYVAERAGKAIEAVR